MRPGRKPKLICIGASAGGVVAVQKILSGLTSQFQVPIAIVQHLPAKAQVRVEISYLRYTSLKIAEIEDKMPFESGHVYFAPPGYHTLVEPENCFSLSVDEPVHFSRPSIDVFFESAAYSLGASVLGILLTGANEDGAQGLFEIHQQGGITVVQDPTTAEMSTMPKAALKLFEPDLVLNLERMSLLLNQIDREVIDGQNENLSSR